MTEHRKIRHPRAWHVFVEHQTTKDGERWVYHTGINYYLPDKFNSQAEASAAVDAKLKAVAKPLPSTEQSGHVPSQESKGI